MLLAFIADRPIAPANLSCRVGTNEIYERVKGTGADFGVLARDETDYEGANRESARHSRQARSRAENRHPPAVPIAPYRTILKSLLTAWRHGPDGAQTVASVGERRGRRHRPHQDGAFGLSGLQQLEEHRARHGPQHDRHDGCRAGVEQPLHSPIGGLTESLEPPEAGVDTLRRDERLVPDSPPPDE